jgi:hypothetical protein
LVGGYDTVSSTPVTAVFTVGYAGGTTLVTPVPQPPLPQALYAPACAITADDTLVSAGGNMGTGGTASVYTASANASTGQISSWSQQAALPVPLDQAAATAWNQTVYVVGGYHSQTSTTVSTVYYATVANGQIAGWSAGPPLPVALSSLCATVVGNTLIVAGGVNVSLSLITSAVWYSEIASDGSLSQWRSAASLPTALQSTSEGWGLITTPAGMLLWGGSNFGPLGAVQSLTVGPAGFSTWQQQTSPIGATDGLPTLTVSNGDGTQQLFALDAASGVYHTTTLYPVPQISVPLPTSGLTNGATYHVTFQQRGGDTINNYLMTGTDTNALPANALTRTRGTGGTWSTYAAGQAIPISLYNNTIPGNATNSTASQAAVHTWDDNGARTSTLIYATTPDQRLLGICEAVTLSSPPLNAQPSFENGVGYWTPTGATFTPSTAVTYAARGFSTSGLLTPSGSAGSALIESEPQTVLVGNPYTVSAWVYSPTGYSNVAVNINWYTSIGAFLSTTSGTVTAVPATTWTQLTVATPSTGAPSGAATGTAVLVESGTPPSTALLYVASASLTPPARVFSSAQSVNYASAWPSSGIYPPLGTTALA